MKTATKLLALVMVLFTVTMILLMPACSTPKIAVTVENEEYTTGEYYAHVYNMFYNIYINQQLYTYEQYHQYYPDYYGDPWEDTYLFGKGDDAREVKLAEYIHLLAQESIKRQVAIERLMKEYDVSLSVADRAQLQEEKDTMRNNAFLAYGFNNASYFRMRQQTNFNERRLFTDLYVPQKDDDGAYKDSMLGIKEADVRAHFDGNYISYKSIELTLPDLEDESLEGDELIAAKAEAASFRERMAQYLADYLAHKDFDTVITQFNADEDARLAEPEDDEDDWDDEWDDEDDTTPTTVPTTTTTAATTTATEAETEPTGAADTDEEPAADENRQDIDASRTGDANFVAAVKPMVFGEAKVIEYEKDQAKPAEGEEAPAQKPNTIALVLRMDPEADRGLNDDGTPVDYYGSVHTEVAASLTFEDFDALVVEEMDKLTMTVDQAAVKALDPKSFKSLLV